MFKDDFQLRIKNMNIPPMDYPDFIIVGLGNPGKRYDNTRHNVGFRAIDYLAEHEEKAHGCKRALYNSLTGRFFLANYLFFMVKPQTYMNNSGIAVDSVMNFYGIPTEKLIVIHDDISLPVGAMRIKRDGSSGGHKGVQSVIDYMESDKFLRIKIGVGQKPEKWDLADYVLSHFNDEESKKIDGLMPKVHEALDCMLKYDVDRMMSEFSISGK